MNNAILIILTIYCLLAFVICVALFTGQHDYELEVKRLKKIIKKQSKEIKKLKNLGDYIYDNYMKKEND